MRNQPRTQDLLVIARQTLLDELLPTLGGEQRYTALMIANAMGMAARECEAGDSEEDKAMTVLRRYLTANGVSETGTADEPELARCIRDRKLPAQDQALHQTLMAITESKLKLSNPKYLKY